MDKVIGDPMIRGLEVILPLNLQNINLLAPTEPLSAYQVLLSTLE